MSLFCGLGALGGAALDDVAGGADEEDEEDGEFEEGDGLDPEGLTHDPVVAGNLEGVVAGGDVFGGGDGAVALHEAIAVVGMLEDPGAEGEGDQEGEEEGDDGAGGDHSCKNHTPARKDHKPAERRLRVECGWQARDRLGWGTVRCGLRLGMRCC